MNLKDGYIRVATIDVSADGIPAVNAPWPAGCVRIEKPTVRPAPGSWLGELFGKPRVYEVSYNFVIEPEQPPCTT